MTVVPLRKPRSATAKEMSDEALARACATGDAAAIGLLFDRFHPRIARYLGRLVSHDEVEDLLQQTFLQVARSSSTFDGRCAVSTWLMAVATNVVRHHRRTMGRRRRLESALAHAHDDEYRDVARDVDSKRKLAAAKRALNALSPALREAFVLCELEGCSAREAGEILGASEAAVWKRVSKARKAIRQEVLGGAR